MSSIDDVNNESSESSEKVSTLSQSLIKSFAVNEKDSNESLQVSCSQSVYKMTPNDSVYKGNYEEIPLGSKRGSVTNKINEVKVRKNETDKCICRII